MSDLLGHGQAACSACSHLMVLLLHAVGSSSAQVLCLRTEADLGLVQVLKAAHVEPRALAVTFSARARAIRTVEALREVWPKVCLISRHARQASPHMLALAAVHQQVCRRPRLLLQACTMLATLRDQEAASMTGPCVACMSERFRESGTTS